MDQTRHCELCKHSKSEYNSGLYCGLTGGKPKFQNTCSKFSLDPFLKTKLDRAYVELRRAKSDKLSHYGLAVIKITVGVVLITFCNLSWSLYQRQGGFHQPMRSWVASLYS